MRKKEVLTLKWNQIRNGWIYITDTKTGNPVELPVSDALAELFDRIKVSQEQVSENVVDMKGEPVKRKTKSEYVFTYNGKPVEEVKTAFKKACKDAGIPYGRNVPGGITFQNLRDTFASYMQNQQGNIRITQELLGHTTPTMTQKYAHVSDDAKKQAVNGLDWDLHE
jgi:integrase